MPENVKKTRILGDLRDQWPLLTVSERFEQIVRPRKEGRVRLAGPPRFQME